MQNHFEIHSFFVFQNIHFHELFVDSSRKGLSCRKQPLSEMPLRHRRPRRSTLAHFLPPAWNPVRFSIYQTDSDATYPGSLGKQLPRCRQNQGRKGMKLRPSRQMTSTGNMWLFYNYKHIRCYGWIHTQDTVQRLLQRSSQIYGSLHIHTSVINSNSKNASYVIQSSHYFQQGYLGIQKKSLQISSYKGHAVI